MSNSYDRVLNIIKIQDIERDGGEGVESSILTIKNHHYSYLVYMIKYSML